MKKFRTAVFAGAAIIILILLITVNPIWDSVFIMSGISSIFTQSEEYPMSVFFFDVGRANAILIRCDGYNIMVDSGREKAQYSSLNYLTLLGVEKLDLLILTHPDKDHIGNMSEVVRSIKTERFVTCQNGDYELTETYSELLKALVEENVEVEYAQSGDTFSFGNLSLNVISPGKVYNTTNNNSVALKAAYGDFSLMLTGDIPQEAEADILNNSQNISSDVICIAHHGSGYSTTDDFLKAVSPKTAIISVEENDYLPSDKVLKRLVDFGCDIYRTDECGTVVVLYDGSSYKVITQL